MLEPNFEIMRFEIFVNILYLSLNTQNSDL